MIFCFYSTSIYAQNCKEDFIENIEKNYRQSKKKFDRIIKKSMQETNLSKSVNFTDFTIINIPVIVGRRAREINVDKTHFFCHLNNKNIEFDEAVILSDSTFLGIVARCPGSDCKYSFYSKTPHVELYIKPLVKEIIEINPDFIFNIYHITNAYWYIKNGKLNVLTFENNSGQITNIKIHKAEEYIQSLSEEDIRAFLYFTRKKVNY